jgi:prefoldin subunit 4
MSQPEVLPDDQVKINRFGNLNTQCVALKMELADLEKKKAGYDDAGDELELAQGEETFQIAPYQIGTAFLGLPLDVAIDEAHRDAEALAERVAGIKAQIAEREKEMSMLRTVLYAKFGREHINLGE